MKELMLITAPVSSRSGYGDHARDLVYSFLQDEKYDIKIQDVPWGDCPRDALDLTNEKYKKINDCIIRGEIKLPTPPEIYVDIRIPNEFEQHGKFNIGITAGVETTAVSHAWIEGCNKMDLIIVPSEHSKQGFVSSIYDKVNNLPDGKQQKVGELKLKKPIEVLFEGADKIFKPLHHKEIDSEFFDWLNSEVPEKFAFLFVGLWGSQPLGEDRKDVGRLIKIFYESFANKKKQPALILKTNGAGFSILDKEECLSKIRAIKSMFPPEWKLPNVYLLHGSFTDAEMNYLYNHPKTKAMVSFTHGEGFGRPLLEATMTGLPVIASNWSGQTDFLDTEKSILLAGKLGQIPKSVVWKNILVEQSEWFNIDENQAYQALNYSFDNHSKLKNMAESLMKENREKFTLEKMTEKLLMIVDKHYNAAPKSVGLKLPKLKSTDNKKQEIPKINLPKLKKV